MEQNSRTLIQPLEIVSFVLHFSSFLDGPACDLAVITAFNYGFIGGPGTGKSALINAIRGMSSRHPLAAGRSRWKPALCERFEFDDDLLAYSVTLWEMHYPRKISAFFEYIE
uniref:Rad50/SbcC-type AAA domain-containing protein n=1 Tax=Parascaris equorum TaxID=6256 RepID=A0A914RAV1_PAREQ